MNSDKGEINVKMFDKDGKPTKEFLDVYYNRWSRISWKNKLRYFWEGNIDNGHVLPVLIVTVLAAGYCLIFGKHIELKLAYNSTRGNKHGKAY